MHQRVYSRRKVIVLKSEESEKYTFANARSTPFVVEGLRSERRRASTPLAHTKYFAKYTTHMLRGSFFIRPWCWLEVRCVMGHWESNFPTLHWGPMFYPMKTLALRYTTMKTGYNGQSTSTKTSTWTSARRTEPIFETRLNGKRQYCDYSFERLHNVVNETFRIVLIWKLFSCNPSDMEEYYLRRISETM